MRARMVWHTAGLTSAILLTLRAVAYILADNLFDAILVGCGAIAIFSLLHQVRREQASSKQEFTVDQLLMMKALIGREEQRVEKRRQEIINELAKKGKTISTEQLLMSVVEELKSGYDGLDRENFNQEIGRLTQ